MDDEDNGGFFSGTFDDPGEAGFSGPSYEGQYGGNNPMYGPDPAKVDDMNRELDRISKQFEDLDKAYDTSYGGMFGTSLGAQRGVIGMDQYGTIETFNPFGERMGPEKAAFAARITGDYDLARDIYGGVERDVPGFMDNISRGARYVGDAVTSRFGTSSLEGYVLGDNLSFIGEVTEDFSGTDLIGNLIGLAVPGGARVDKALAVDPRTEKEMEFGTASTIFGESTYLSTPEEAQAKRDAGTTFRDSQGEGPASPSVSGIPATALINQATQSTGSRLLRQFINAAAPSIYPRAYQMFNQGGKAKQPEVPPEQMDSLMSQLPLPPMDQLRENPERFLKDPNKAKTAEETSKIYDYNQRILDISISLPKRSLAVEGGVQGQEVQVAQGGPAGFIEQKPENLDDATTVADDVPMEVPEGTFIINAAAAEHAGSEDIKKMILSAMNEARKQGLDTTADISTIDRENAVSLLVSRGEVVVPPLLAKIIGYDRLNKINNRGKKETEKRVQENGQSPQAESISQQPRNPAEGSAMARGGFISKSK